MNPAGDLEGGGGLYEGVVERPENVLVYSEGTELPQEVLSRWLFLRISSVLEENFTANCQRYDREWLWHL